MSVQPDLTSQNIAAAISDISEHATVLIREEIELAKAEVIGKLTKLIKGAIVGLAAGGFLLLAVLFALHGLAWLAWYEFFPAGQIFWGYLVVAGGLVVLGALAGFIAARALRGGASPTPAMAIDEARKIRDAVATKDAGT